MRDVSGVRAPSAATPEKKRDLTRRHKDAKDKQQENLKGISRSRKTARIDWRGRAPPYEMLLAVQLLLRSWPHLSSCAGRSILLE